MEYIKIATGTAADSMAEAAGWADYAQHVSDSEFTTGYYIADMNQGWPLTDAEVSGAHHVVVDVVSEIEQRFTMYRMDALVVNGEYYVDPDRFTEYFVYWYCNLFVWE